MERICPPGYHDIDIADHIYDPLFTAVFSYLKYSGIKGDVAEFGCYRGYSARLLAKYMRDYKQQGRLLLFDSWEGMPDINSDYDKKSYEVAVLDDWKKGCYSVPDGTVEQIRNDVSAVLGSQNVSIVKGYYQNTLRDIDFSPESVALVNVDCDLFESIELVLRKLLDTHALFDGSVILFDDWNFNRANPNMGARKAVSSLFNETSRYQLSFFLNYSWHGRAFFVHDREYEV